MAKPDPAADGNGPVGAPAAPLRDPLFWTRSIPLTARILFVNIFALALFAGSLFYLDSYRNQLLVERFETARSEAEIVSDALVALPDAEARERLIVEIARDQRSRIRTYDPRGRLVAPISVSEAELIRIGGPSGPHVAATVGGRFLKVNF